MARRPLSPPVRFTYDGLYSSALPGETLLQALARKRVPILSRSIKYHRARGPICGTGQCAGCLVRVNGMPNVRACQAVPRAGDVVRSENAWPSVRFDLFALFDLLFPRHLDTLHGFRRPLLLRPAYHAVVRRLAGTGRLPDVDPGSGAPPAPTKRWTTDVLVVGAGPAGSRVALGLAQGPQAPAVLLVDRRSADATALPETPRPPRLLVRPGYALSFLPAPSAGSHDPSSGGFVGIAVPQDGSGAVEVRAPTVVLATGGYDAFLLFTGNDRPGVLTGDGALALRGEGGSYPFSRALVFGGGGRVVELLGALKGHVAFVVAPDRPEPEVTEAARRAGAELLANQLLVAASGRRRVRGALLRDRSSGTRRRVAVDAIVLAHRRVPNVPLLFQAGAKMAWRDEPGAYFPDVDDDGATSVPGLYVVGELAGPGTGASLEAQADRTLERVRSGPGPKAARRGDGPSVPSGETNAKPGGGWLSPYYLELLRQPVGGKRVLCPCEDVVVEELDEAVHDGFTGTEVIKRYTGAGTGVCQGRYCLPDVLVLLSLFEGRPPSEVGFITQRPPVFPTLLSDLARLPPEVEPPVAPVHYAGPEPATASSSTTTTEAR